MQKQAVQVLSGLALYAGLGAGVLPGCRTESEPIETMAASAEEQSHPGLDREGRRRWRMGAFEIGVEVCNEAGDCEWQTGSLLESCEDVGDGLRSLEEVGESESPVVIRVIDACTNAGKPIDAALDSLAERTGLRPAEALALAELWYDAVLSPSGSQPRCGDILAALGGVGDRLQSTAAQTSGADITVRDGKLLGVPRRLLPVVASLGAIGEPAGGLPGERGLAGFWMLAAGMLGARAECGTYNRDHAVSIDYDATLALDISGPQKPMLLQKPKLWMPFATGTSHQCTQGNNGSTSHTGSTTLHALDLDTSNAADEEIRSALAGKVAYVKTGCVVGNTSCGGGFGNHVRLAHGGNYYTMYGHLKSTSVVVGDKVGRGVLLGYDGTTGLSDGDHLHFALHNGDAAAAAVAPTVSSIIRAKDGINGSYADIASGSFVCGIPGGHYYYSDNVCSKVYDTLGTAKQITSNIDYLGELCAVGDVDYFYFGGKAGPFTATVKSTSESITDCSCAILNDQGVELPLGGAEGYARNDNYNGSEGCSCSLTNATSAKHYLKIYSQMPGAYLMKKTLP